MFVILLVVFSLHSSQSVILHFKSNLLINVQWLTPSVNSSWLTVSHIMTTYKTSDVTMVWSSRLLQRWYDSLFKPDLLVVRIFFLLFYFEIKGALTSAFPPFACVLLDCGGAQTMRGGLRRWESVERGAGGCLAVRQSEAPERPPAPVTAGPRLEVLSSAAKSRSMAALNGLRPHWRSASTRARVTMDAQRLPGVAKGLGG